MVRIAGFSSELSRFNVSGSSVFRFLMSGRDDESGLWESILQEGSGGGRMPDATLLMLGRPGIGKRTLAQALLTHASAPPASADWETATGHSRAVAIDYAHFAVRDPADEETAAPDYVCPAACSVVILEDPSFAWLLRGTVSQLNHCAAAICLDLKEPWTMMEDLRAWLQLLQKFTAELLLALPLAEQDALRGRVVRAMQCQAKTDAENLPPGADSEEGQDCKVEDKAEPALVYNMGMPVIVVVNRADGSAAFETQKTMGWAETIEAHLRQECASYGAAIIYTQAKHNNNVDLLYSYLMHRLYDFSFTNAAQVPSRDALFLPSGWDSKEKIDEIVGRLSGGLDRSFESVVVPPSSATATAPAAEEAEDMNTFLQNAHGLLQKLGGSQARRQDSQIAAVSGAASGAASGTASGEKTVKRSTTAMSFPEVTPAAASPAAPRRFTSAEPGPAPTPDPSSLATFFDNLLKRSQTGPGGAPDSKARAVTARTERPKDSALVPPDPKKGSMSAR